MNLYTRKENPYNSFSETSSWNAFESQEDALEKLHYETMDDQTLEDLRKEFFTNHYDAIKYSPEMCDHSYEDIRRVWNILNTLVMNHRKRDGIETIELLPLAVSGLNQEFTFKRHDQLYKVRLPYISFMFGTQSVDKSLEEEIKTYFNIINPIRFDHRPMVKNPLDVNNSSELKIRPLNENELITTDWLEKVLNKVNAKSLIHEYNRQIGKSDFYDKVARVLNKFVSRDTTKRLVFSQSRLGRLVLGAINYIEQRSKTRYSRSYHQAGYLGVRCLVSEIPQASALLAYDLSKLESIDAIQGNLTKQSVLPLADSVGDGNARCVVLCYPLLKYPVNEVLSKICDYAIDENASNIKSISKDPEIIIINNDWERKVKVDADGKLVQYSVPRGHAEHSKSSPMSVGMKGLLAQIEEDMYSPKKSKRKSTKAKTSPKKKKKALKEVK